MTESQIRYHTLVETKRHDLVQEKVWQQQNAEQHRSNVANEALKAEANSISRYAVDVQKYGIETNAATQRYVANLNAETQRYTAQLNAETTRYVTDQNVAASRYATDVNAAVNVQRIQNDAEIASNRLAFDRQTQVFKNAMETKRYNLDQLNSRFQRNLTAAQEQQTKAQAQKIMSDIRVSVEQLTLQAKQYGLQEEAAKWNNALTKARQVEAESKAFSNYVGSIGKIVDFVSSIAGLFA